MSWTIPQQQQSQNAPADLQERLLEEVRALPGVDVGPSRISVPGARGFTLREGSADDAGFLVPRSASSPTCTRPTTARCTWPCPRTWPPTSRPRAGAAPHMWAGTRLSPGFMLVHGPRDDDELAMVRGIVAASHAYATRRA